ncbi:hypothetical protein J0X14_14590 [Muricauda sp. CAU 1633]|uniref:hypothetical protein n=1 Tax=Allomuricauda sp. CAU 1633 TaxID=2816036 RepID=UPI001A8C716C|nr:hypothetical protein [Muricauda sp. CAU 1633]MBO0323534.1 hypothetical protein [Muricauda sp. CAU 1633]
MKKIYLIWVGLVGFALLSCDGSFEPDEFAINLKYPEPNSKCEEGTTVGGRISIPFRWELQGNISSFDLVLNGETIDAQPVLIDGTYQFDWEVDFSSDYKWKVVSDLASSEERVFRTPSALPNDNNVPLAVKFNETVLVSTSGGTTQITVRWTGGDQENDGNLKYDAYWSRDANISPENETNGGESKDLVNTSVTFQIPNFDANEYYYILVVARDLENAAYSTLKYCQLCSD